MNIALLTLTGPEFRGGVEKFNSYLNSALSKKHSVDIIAFNDFTLSGTEKAVLKVYEKTPYSGYYKAKIMAKHFSKIQEKYNLIITNDFFGLYIKKPKQILVSHGYFGDVFDCMRDRISPWYWLWGQELGRVQKASMKKADFVVTPCMRNFRVMKEKKLRVDLVIPHGIDTDFYKPDKNASKNISSYALPKNFLLFVGGRAPWKNIGIVEEISKKNKIAMISGNGSSPNISYLNNVPENLMPSFYSASQMLLHPSLHEGFGYVVAESMASGTPALFSRTGFGEELSNELPELVMENPSDVPQIRKEIDFILENKKSLGKKSREFVIKNFGLKNWEKKWLELVEKI